MLFIYTCDKNTSKPYLPEQALCGCNFPPLSPPSPLIQQTLSKDLKSICAERPSLVRLGLSEYAQWYTVAFSSALVSLWHTYPSRGTGLQSAHTGYPSWLWVAQVAVHSGLGPADQPDTRPCRMHTQCHITMEENPLTKYTRAFYPVYPIITAVLNLTPLGQNMASAVLLPRPYRYGLSLGYILLWVSLVSLSVCATIAPTPSHPPLSPFF